MPRTAPDLELVRLRSCLAGARRGRRRCGRVPTRPTSPSSRRLDDDIASERADGILALDDTGIGRCADGTSAAYASGHLCHERLQNRQSEVT